MKTTIIAVTPVFSWEIGQEVQAEISYLEDGMHQIMIDGVKHIFESSKTMFENNTTIITSGFLTDNINVGVVGFKFEF